MKRWLPSPWMSGVLLLMWLLLNQSLEAAQILLGVAVGVAIPLLIRNLQPLGYRQPARPVLMLRLLAMAFVEIVRSGFNVGRIILFARPQGLNAQFIRVPLDLRNPFGLALLSCLVNSTPGTVWVEILPGTHQLALHVFDLHDEQWWIEAIKSRYEQPLIDIFE
jgi:multicomponent K+:H+ antiporter subunit E